MAVVVRMERYFIDDELGEWEIDDKFMVQFVVFGLCGDDISEILTDLEFKYRSDYDDWVRRGEDEMQYVIEIDDSLDDYNDLVLFGSEKVSVLAVKGLIEKIVAGGWD